MFRYILLRYDAYLVRNPVTNVREGDWLHIPVSSSIAYVINWISIHVVICLLDYSLSLPAILSSS